MSDKAIPQAVLSDVLYQKIDKRRVKAAVFLTFQFDPGFFEEEILPILFGQPFSHVPKIRLLQLEEALRGVNHLAVYYDRRGLTADAQPARLDYRRIGLARATGFFHPKNILLLLENHGGKSGDSLLIATLSANLTRAGWWENVEVAHLEEVRAGDKCVFRKELLDLIERIKGEDRTGEDHTALEALREFLMQYTAESKWGRKHGRWLPRLYVGQESVPEFLGHSIERDQFNLEIISPYFDGDDSAATLRSLLKTTAPRETRVFLPEAKDGAALCRGGFFEAVEQMPGVRWGKLPASLLRSSSADKSAIADRFVHAKVYRFWDREREIFFVGSANLTHPAHQPGHAGNFETGILVEPETRSCPTWWLEAGSQARPDEFRPGEPEDAEGAEVVDNLSLRFNWESGRLDYFWEKPSGTGPRRAAVAAQGVYKFSIKPILFGEWVTLPDKDASQVEQLLKSTSFVEVSVDSERPFRVLVREEGMAHKHSILLSSSAEEILQYWSLLSPEQREAFLNRRAPSLADGTEFVMPPIEHPVRDTMFDRFAGIFHAFGRLESHVREAMQEGREAEAVYRLFGEKYDSLPSLIQTVIKDECGDRVNRYVTLLCARQILGRIEAFDTQFTRRHQAEFRRVSKLLGAVDRLREGFSFGSPEEREKFFDWFEQMFFLEIPILEQESGQ
jgi:hypothetical protein